MLVLTQKSFEEIVIYKEDCPQEEIIIRKGERYNRIAVQAPIGYAITRRKKTK